MVSRAINPGSKITTVPVALVAALLPRRSLLDCECPAPCCNSVYDHWKLKYPGSYYPCGPASEGRHCSPHQELTRIFHSRIVKTLLGFASFQLLSCNAPLSTSNRTLMKNNAGMVSSANFCGRLRSATMRGV